MRSGPASLLLQDGAVLELPAIVLVAIGGLAQAALGEPSGGDVIRKSNAAGIHRPGPAVDSCLIENPAATSAGKGQPRAASGRNRFDRANFPIVRAPRRQPFHLHTLPPE